MPVRSPQHSLAKLVWGDRAHLLAAVWAYRLYSPLGLKSVDGRKLRIDWPGWSSGSESPRVFERAEIEIEGQELIGDVELWLPGEGRTPPRRKAGEGNSILQVCLGPMTKEEPKGSLTGSSPGSDLLEHWRAGDVPLLDLRPRVDLSRLPLFDEANQLLEHYDRLPGRCGLRTRLVGVEALERLLTNAAELRMRLKAERIGQRVGVREAPAQSLYAGVLRALGYTPYADLFEDLAAAVTLEEIGPFLALPLEDARRQVLARWFGALGLLEGDASAVLPQLRTEYRTWQAIWHALERPILHPWRRRGGASPESAPEARLVGLFYHLRQLGGHAAPTDDDQEGVSQEGISQEGVSQEGGAYAALAETLPLAEPSTRWTHTWLASWYRFLLRLHLEDEALPRRGFIGRGFISRSDRLLQDLFRTPDEESWRSLYHLGRARPRPVEPITVQRARVILTNAVLPFFLAQARQQRDEPLENLLYRLFLVIPGEGDNHLTRFMKRRLSPFVPPQRSLRVQQGLIQVKQDFCHTFSRGCVDCELPTLIHPPQNLWGIAPETASLRSP